MDFLLVIPCLNESERLPTFLPELASTLEKQAYQCGIQIVDDGSTPREKAFLIRHVEELRVRHPQLLDVLMLEKNLGKGGAIRAGWQSNPGVNWLAFVDADGAVPAHEVAAGLERALADQDRNACYFSSRMGGGGKSVRRAPLRSLAGWVFAKVANSIMSTGLRDTQCGFKIIPRELFEKSAHLFQENGYCFDLELLAAARHFGFQVEEFAIDWREIAGGKIRVSDVFKMFKQISRLKNRVREW